MSFHLYQAAFEQAKTLEDKLAKGPKGVVSDNPSPEEFTQVCNHLRKKAGMAIVTRYFEEIKKTGFIPTPEREMAKTRSKKLADLDDVPLRIEGDIIFVSTTHVQARISPRECIAHYVGEDGGSMTIWQVMLFDDPFIVASKTNPPAKK